MALNGSNYLAIAANSLPSLSGNANYTIGMWINTTEVGASVLYKGTTGSWTTHDEDFFLSNGAPNSNTGAAGTFAGGVQYAGGFVGGSTPVNTGTWEFISYVRSGGATTVYVNGVADGVSTPMDLAENGTQIMAIGYNSGVAHDGAVMFSGSVSGTYVYGGASSAAQIQSLYNAGPAGIHGSLPSTTDVSIVAAGAALDVNGAEQAINSLSGAAGANVYLGGGTLAIGGTGSTTYAGNISDAGGASSGNGGGLLINGGGTLTLTGTAAYTGGTVADNGTLIAMNNEAIGDFALEQTGIGTNLYVGNDLGAFGTIQSAAQAAALPAGGVAAVPEPGALALAAAGAVAAWTCRFARRWKQRKRR